MVQITSQKLMIRVYCTAVGVHIFGRVYHLSFFCNKKTLKLKKTLKVNNNNNISVCGIGYNERM
jgi:hypothetical protein